VAVVAAVDARAVPVAERVPDLAAGGERDALDGPVGGDPERCWAVARRRLVPDYLHASRYTADR
jgi:hypothetical protein